MATQKQIDKALVSLHKAIAKYVEVRGGKVLVTGDVQVIKFPGDLQYNWTLGVRCTGRPPVMNYPDGNAGSLDNSQKKEQI